MKLLNQGKIIIITFSYVYWIQAFYAALHPFSLAYILQQSISPFHIKA